MNSELKPSTSKDTPLSPNDIIPEHKELKSKIIKQIKDNVQNKEDINKNDILNQLDEYFQLLDRIPLSLIFYELLTLNNSFGQDISPPPWFVKAIGIKLSSCLMTKNGLSHLFIALNDLGGESFWQNSVVLSFVAKLLATKPIKAESYKKYVSLIFGQFLDILKNERFGKQASMLFSMTVDNLYKNDQFIVEVQLIDKLVRPWELLLERGEMNECNESYGLWNHNLDSSIIILKNWFSIMPRSTTFTKDFHFGYRFIKFIPLWLYLSGQALIDETTKNLSNDLNIILEKLMEETIFKNPTKLLNILINEGKNVYEYIELTKNDEKNKITEEIDKFIPKYPVKLNIRDEPFNEESFIDYKIDGLKNIFKNMDKKCVLKSITLLMTDCLNTWLNDSNKIEINEDECRFVPELESKIRNKEIKFAAVFVMGSISDYLTDIDVEYDNDILIGILEIIMTIFNSAIKKLKEYDEISEFTEDCEAMIKIESTSVGLATGLVAAILTNAQNDSNFILHLQKMGEIIYQYIETYNKLSDCLIKNYYSTSYEYCSKILELLKDDLHLLDENYSNKTNIVKTNNESKMNNPKIKIDEWKEMLEDDEEAIKAAALIEIAKILRKKDTKIFSTEDGFEWLWITCHEQAIHTDSYVFLAAINALVELAYWKSEPYLERLVDKFSSWSEKEKIKDEDLMFCGKLGEALAKLFARSGDYSTLYFDRFSNSLLNMMKAKDEIIKSSSISSLSDLIISTKGRKFTAILSELLLMISQILKTDDSPLVRRSSIHLLKSIITSTNNTILETLGNHLREIYGILRRMWLNDKDEVVRFHAEVALIELKNRILNSDV